MAGIYQFLFGAEQHPGTIHSAYIHIFTNSALWAELSSSRNVVCFFVSLMSPFHVIFFCGPTGADRASSVDWCDLDLDLE